MLTSSKFDKVFVFKKIDFNDIYPWSKFERIWMNHYWEIQFVVFMTSSIMTSLSVFTIFSENEQKTIRFNARLEATSWYPLFSVICLVIFRWLMWSKNHGNFHVFVTCHNLPEIICCFELHKSWIYNSWRMWRSIE